MGWTTEEGEFSQMEGTTVTSRTTTDAASGNSVAHFAHTFTVDLRFDINQLDMMKELYCFRLTLRMAYFTKLKLCSRGVT